MPTDLTNQRVSTGDIARSGAATETALIAALEAKAADTAQKAAGASVVLLLHALFSGVFFRVVMADDDWLHTTSTRLMKTRLILQALPFLVSPLIPHEVMSR